MKLCRELSDLVVYTNSVAAQDIMDDGEDSVFLLCVNIPGLSLSTANLSLVCRAPSRIPGTGSNPPCLSGDCPPVRC